MVSIFIMLGSVMALLAVALGAFGAHALKKRLDNVRLANYQTGVQYQMYHAGGLIVTGIVARLTAPSVFLEWAGWLFFAGIVLFSGSLYLLSLFDRKWWGMVTPFGGVAFIIAWGFLAIVASHRI